MSILSREAGMMRWAMRNYVVSKLRLHNVVVPVNLINVTKLALDDEQTKLNEALIVAVDLFDSMYGIPMQSIMEPLPSTVPAIVELVMEANRDALTYGDVTWGRMVAVTALINAVALRSVRREMGEVVVPLIDHASILAEQKLVTFVRENGNWQAFEYVFAVKEEEEQKKKKEHGWLYKRLAAIGNFLKGIGGD
jgi:hypothetical protein